MCHRLSVRCAKTVAQKSLRGHGAYDFLSFVRGTRERWKAEAILE
jgi:hypothetical protein